MKKIAYASVIEDVSALYGVYAKVMDQHRACVQAHIPMDVHVFSYHSCESVPDGMRFHVLEKRGNKASKLYFQAREIAQSLAGYDVVVLRALAWTPLYVLGMRRKSFALITEYHTKPLAELLTGKRLVTWAVYAGSKRACMAQSDGVLCVTGEIRDNVLSKNQAMIPAKTVPNGVDVDSISPTGCAAFDGKELRLAFVASALNPWHGLDRVVTGLNAYQGEVPIRLHLIGDIKKDLLGLANPRVRPVFHGVLQRDKMNGVLSDMHLGISSLAIFRNRMREACVLKSREYMARGLPFVYAYDDPDLDQGLAFCRKFPGSEAAIRTEDLLDFARFMALEKASCDVTEAMRGYARQRMDWKPKMAAIHDFALSLAGRAV